MAIINLGLKTPTVGGGVQLFDPFFYDEREAYIFYCDMAISNIKNVFSYLQFRPLVTPDNEATFALAPYIDIPIRESRQAFFFAASRLFNGSGQCVFEVERLPFIPTTGDSEVLQVILLYDNALTVKSWRD